MSVDHIRERWQRFSEKRFPGLRGNWDVDDVCLISMDTAIAGCISTFCSRTMSGRLDSEREAILRRSVSRIEGILERMPSPDVETHFRELLAIACCVLEYVEANRHK